MLRLSKDRLKAPEGRAVNKAKVSFTSSIQDCPDYVTKLAGRLAFIHGRARIAKESSGWIIYIPSPTCLEKYGKSELMGMHMAVSPDIFYGRKQNVDATSLCAFDLKEQTTHDVFDLLNYKPIHKRLEKYKEVNPSLLYKVTGADTSKCLIEDEHGNLIPDGPGETTSLLTLKASHPAIVYLQDRGFDIESLVNQFNCSWCFQEALESREKGRFYKKLPGGFKDTPQNRIIFDAWVNGSRQGWQARMLDYTKDNITHIYHPYDEEYVPVFEINPDTGKPSKLLLGSGEPKDFDISKYKTGFGVKRTKVLLGFDAMLAWNKLRNTSIAVLVEGPLDAGKIGPPAVSMMGKYLADGQAQLFHNKIKKVLFIRDNDIYGKQTSDKVVSTLQRYVKLVETAEIPNAYKDVGQMSLKDAKDFVSTHLNLKI